MPLDERFYMHHLSVYNVKKFEQGYMKYSDIEAELKFKDGERSSLFMLFIKVLYLLV